MTGFIEKTWRGFQGDGQEQKQGLQKAISMIQAGLNGGLEEVGDSESD